MTSFASSRKSSLEDPSFSSPCSEGKSATLPVTKNVPHGFNFWDVGGYRKTVKRCESGHKLVLYIFFL